MTVPGKSAKATIPLFFIENPKTTLPCLAAVRVGLIALGTE